MSEIRGKKDEQRPNRALFRQNTVKNVQILEYDRRNAQTFSKFLFHAQ